MTPEAALWTFTALLLLALTAFAGWRREKAKRNRTRLDRSDAHQAQINALGEWLRDAKIVQTVLDQRVATTRAALSGILTTLEVMTEDEIKASIIVLLRDRTVRRVIADYETSRIAEQEGQEPPREAVMRALLQWARPEEVKA